VHGRCKNGLFFLRFDRLRITLGMWLVRKVEDEIKMKKTLAREACYVTSPLTSVMQRLCDALPVGLVVAALLFTAFAPWCAQSALVAYFSFDSGTLAFGFGT
jgi:hypothetical protein